MEDRNLVLADFYRELHDICQDASWVQSAHDPRVRFKLADKAVTDLDDLIHRMRSYRDKQIDDAVDAMLDELEREM